MMMKQIFRRDENKNTLSIKRKCNCKNKNESKNEMKEEIKLKIKVKHKSENKSEI